MGPRRTLLMHAWLQAALWVGLALVVNHLASTFFFRADLTATQRFTLSEVARESVADLEQPLVAKVWFTSELEAPYHDHERALVDKLEELRAYSGGMLEISVQDPTGNPPLVQEIEQQGVVPVPYRFQSDNRVELKQVFMHVTLFHGGNTQVLGPMSSTATMEYELVRAIRDLRTPAQDRKTLGYLSGFGGPEFLEFQGDNPITKLRARLLERYDLVPVRLGADEGVPDTVDALLVVGPRETVSDRAQYQIDQFVMGGGSVAFFVQTMQADLQRFRALPIRHELAGLVGSYGVRLNKDTVFDVDHAETYPFPTRTGRTVEVSYPLIPYTTNIERTHPMVRQLQKAILPFASTLTLDEELPTGVQAQLLVQTEPSAYRTQGLRHIAPDVFRLEVPGQEAGPHPVAYALTGRFQSYFAERPIPPPAGMDPNDPAWNPDPTEKVLDSSPTRVLVVGSGDFLANNTLFVQNAVDWLLEDEALLAIRSKLAAADTMEPPLPNQARLIKAGIVGVPLLLLLAAGGLVLLLSRRRA